jgi:hypothetical protein
MSLEELSFWIKECIEYSKAYNEAIEIEDRI